jgi:glycosyltransferase involved in cell wall biosynthesis
MCPRYHMVVLSDDWNGLPFSCRHLLRHFLPEVPLIWVETIGLRPPGLSVYDYRRAFSKLSGWVFGSRDPAAALPENLTLVNPLQIPYNHYRFIRRLNARNILRSIRAMPQERASDRRVLLTTWPFVGDLVGALGEHLSIYYRVDDYSEFPGVRKESIRQLERQLIARVDMVVASAENLMPTGSGGKAARYLPHGVDFDHFSSAPPGGYAASVVAALPPPRIGFFGLLNSWIDLHMLQAVAREHRAWSFVLLGPSQLPKKALPSEPNMHFLGPVSYEELPAHARLFDVGLIPFKINALTACVNPLKLMEYFALGIPVASTPLPEVVKFRDHVYLGEGVSGFADCIERALAEKNAGARRARQDVARKHSWEAKSRQLRRWIAEAL